ncbi:hypothetical protein [Nocardioides lijunqiniae]|uniref:hypothetical protein n=1 Tax=Nocardioides lijunqiniae TaxID=2760832 RepID=UPI001877755A|nr:hypothetical protein [Nocardioides lijunqiniae]
MRSSLAVRIRDGYTSRHVTRHVKDLRFKKTAPGGHHSASMRVSLPPDTFRDLNAADKVWIYDTSTGRTVFEGYVESPGTKKGPTGEAYELGLVGGVLLASDQSQPMVYIDRDLSPWFQYTGGAPSSQASSGSDPADDNVDGLLVQFPPGQPISGGAVAQIGYGAVGGFPIGAIGCVTRSGKVDTGYQNQIPTAVPTAQIPPNTGISTVASAKVARFAGDSPGLLTGQSQVVLRIRRSGGSTNIADDNTWTFFSDVSVLGRRMDRYGDLLTGAAEMITVEHVRADWVVEDLLGRLLTRCDPDASVIEAATWAIDQLAYRDGVKASQVLEDLALWEPDMLWEILESNRSGLHRFNYRAWPTTPRYEISTADGFDLTGAEIDLCNRIAVNWVDIKGQQQVTVVTAYVPELAESGRIRDAEPVTLPPGQGSEANALRIGQQVLAAKADPPTAATARVARPILDHLTGSRVKPWEIEPGYLTRVRETGEDLRLTEVDFEDSSCTASLTLGTPAPTNEQRIARLSTIRRT